MQNIHTETKWLWSVREDYTHLQCEASSIAPKVSAAQSSRNGYFPHWNFWKFEKWGKKFAKSIFRVKKFRIWNIIFFFKRNWENHHLPRSFPILWRKKKIPSSPTSFFSYTINNAHEAVNALRKIDLQIQQKVMNSVNLLRS